MIRTTAITTDLPMRTAIKEDVSLARLEVLLSPKICLAHILSLIINIHSGIQIIIDSHLEIFLDI